MKLQQSITFFFAIAACHDKLADPPGAEGTIGGSSGEQPDDSSAGDDARTATDTTGVVDSGEDGTSATTSDTTTGVSTSGEPTASDDVGEPMCDPDEHDPVICFRELSPGTMLGGDNPAAFRSGDLDRDGVLDLLTVDVNSRSVSTYRGIGDGWFWPGNSYSVDPEGTGGMIYNPVGGVLVDLDGDDDDELLVGLLELLSSDLLVFASEGTLALTLTSTQPLPAQIFGFEAAVLDVDDDGDDDVATNAGMGGIALVRNQGGGAIALESIATAELPTNVLAHDMMGDPAIDVIVSHSAGIEVLENQAGTLVSAAAVAGPDSPGGLAVGDLDGDGIADLVAVDVVAAELQVRLGTGTGFGEPTIVSSTFDSATEHSRADLELADFDGDGDLDLVSGGVNDGVVVFRGNGDGTIDDPQRHDVGHSLVLIEVGDLDGDGRPDIAALNGLSALRVLINDPCACDAPK
jgi:hypothetical protein